jgi:hypothetical protein
MVKQRQDTDRNSGRDQYEGYDVHGLYKCLFFIAKKKETNVNERTRWKN